MTPAPTIRRLGLTQPEAARLLGVSKSTIEKWCVAPSSLAHRDCPEPVWRLLGLMENVPGVREWLSSTNNNQGA